MLQSLVEKNLDTVFKCRLVATEFSTGAQHAGRIDTLALSEDDNPVIIEYKVVESSDLVNQSLFYLSWIQDHRGDFEIAAQKALGPQVQVDWSDVRVICIAPNYRKYDLHAVRMMGANIELWTYRLFTNDVLYFEEVLQKSDTSVAPVAPVGKNPVMVAAGKKAAAARATGSYTFDQHIDGKPEAMRELAVAVSDFITSLDPSIEVSPKKFYVAFKTSQNIVCMEVKQQRVLLYLKLNPKVTSGPKDISRDVSDVGHYGTGDLEISIKSQSDLEAAKPFVQQAYEQVGG
jgi:predicted transport protein